MKIKQKQTQYDLFLVSKALHAVLAGFLGIIIGSTGTMSALSNLSAVRAQEATSL